MMQIDSSQPWQSLSNSNYETLFQPEVTNPKFVETVAEINAIFLQDIAEIVSYDQAALLLGYGTAVEIITTGGWRLTEIATLLTRNEDVLTQIYTTQTGLIHIDQSKATTPQQWLGLPLRQSKQIIGLLLCNQPVITDDDDRAFQYLSALAQQSTIALKYARQYHQLTDFSEALENELESSTSDLQVAHLELDHLDQIKCQFISRASHELRTPLTSICGYTDMLLTNSTIKQQTQLLDYINSIKTSSSKMSTLVTELIDMTKIESNALTLHREVLSVVTLLHQVCQNLAAVLAERGITLRQNIASDLPNLEADCEMLHKTFTHLIGNAIKYTPDDGYIQVDSHLVEYEINGQPRKAIEIVIRDWGIGIDKFEQPLIFGKFHQIGQPELHSSGKTKFKGNGLGLGLTIAKGFINAHGGQIWVKSNGHDEQRLTGSQIHVRLPLPHDHRSSRRQKRGAVVNKFKSV